MAITISVILINRDKCGLKVGINLSFGRSQSHFLPKIWFRQNTFWYFMKLLCYSYKKGFHFHIFKTLLSANQTFYSLPILLTAV